MQRRGKTWGPYKQNASASVYFPKLVSLVLTLLYCLLETHKILSPPRKKFLKSIALTPPLSSRSSLPACWVFHECHQHLKSNTLRHKMWLSPISSLQPVLLSPAHHSHSKSVAKLPVPCSSCLWGCSPCPHCSVLWLSALGGSLDLITLCIWNEKFANEAGGKCYAFRRWHQSLLEAALPSVAPKYTGSCICLVHLSSLQGSGLVCRSPWREKAWPRTPCHLFHLICWNRWALSLLFF